MKKTVLYILISLIVFQTAPAKQKVRIALFEGGKYIVHDVLREEYFKQLEALLPDSIEIIKLPSGYRSADWNRSYSKHMALELTANTEIDLLLAFGPWVIEDLLEAGFDKPVIGMHQQNSEASKLLSFEDKPVAENLTLHLRPGKVFDDIQLLKKLFPFERLGLLSFTDSLDTDLLERLTYIGEKEGFEVFSASEYDNIGTYAFFKSYFQIRRKAQVIYLTPLHGLDNIQIEKFLEMLRGDSVITFIDEGGVLLSKGAAVTNNYFGVISEARFAAYKTVKILEGAKPSELPVLFRSGYHLALNKKVLSSKLNELDIELLNNYTTVGEPEKDTLETFLLKDLITRAISSNPQILASQSDVEKSEASEGLTKSGYKPQVSVNAEAGYWDENLRHNSLNRIDETYLLSSLDVEQKLFSLETFKQMKASQIATSMSRVELSARELDLELAVSLAFLDLLKQQELVKLYNNQRNMIDYALETAHTDVRLGLKDSLDIYLLESERYNLVQSKIEATKLYNIAKQILNTLMNQFPEFDYNLIYTAFNEQSFIDREYKIREKFPNKNSQAAFLRKLETKYVDNSPEYTLANEQIEWKETLLEANKATYYPDISLFGSLYYNNYLKESDLFTEKKSGWTVGGKLTLPLFSGGSRSKKSQILKSEINRDEYLRDDIRLHIMKDCQVYSEKVFSSAEKFLPAYLSKQKSIRAFELGVDKYLEGTVSTEELINIIRYNQDNESDAIDIRFEYFVSAARLIRVLGIQVSDGYTDFLERFQSVIEN